MGFIEERTFEFVAGGRRSTSRSRQEAMAKEQREILDARQAYFMPLIEAGRRTPVEDMISAMACAEVAGERLSDLEILATCNMIATAGGGTSRSTIAMSLW
jgi:cytochrome P450